MKKFYILLGGVILSSVPTGGYSATCIDWGEASVLQPANAQTLINSCTELHERDDKLEPNDPHCATFKDYTFITKYDDGTCIRLGWCETCPSGYQLVDRSDVLKIGDYCYNPSDTIWQTMQNTPIDQWVCAPIECDDSEYKIDAGCQPCPNREFARSFSPRTAITDCYIPRNESLTDTTGTYVFTSECRYTK